MDVCSGRALAGSDEHVPAGPRARESSARGTLARAACACMLLDEEQLGQSEARLWSVDGAAERGHVVAHER